MEDRSLLNPALRGQIQIIDESKMDSMTSYNSTTQLYKPILQPMMSSALTLNLRWSNVKDQQQVSGQVRRDFHNSKAPTIEEKKNLFECVSKKSRLYIKI